MKNIETVSKEALVKEFLANRVMITEVNGLTPRVIDYYGKKYGYNQKGNKILKDFIEDNLYYLLENEETELNNEILKKWINDIKDYEICDYIDGLIDIYDEELVKSYSYFQEWIDNYGINLDSIQVIMSAQSEGYYEVINDIKVRFCEFLEEKLD